MKTYIEIPTKRWAFGAGTTASAESLHDFLVKIYDKEIEYIANRLDNIERIICEVVDRKTLAGNAFLQLKEIAFVQFTKNKGKVFCYEKGET